MMGIFLLFLTNHHLQGIRILDPVSLKHIEVKMSKGKFDTTFYITRNE